MGRQYPGQGDQRVFPADRQHPCLLAGAGAFDGFRGMAEGASDWLERPHRRGGQRRDHCGSDSACHFAGHHLKHYRDCQYHAAYPGKDGGDYGERLCTVCPCEGREHI